MNKREIYKLVITDKRYNGEIFTREKLMASKSLADKITDEYIEVNWSIEYGMLPRYSEDALKVYKQYNPDFKTEVFLVWMYEE